MSDPSIQRGPSNEIPVLGYDPATKHAVLPLKIGSVVQDATTGQWYGILDVAATISSSALPTGAATAANQTTGNASLSSIDGKITTVNTGAVTVASSALPTGAATSANQTTGNASLTSIDGKITAVNTGAVVVSSSALPTGAATNSTEYTEGATDATITGNAVLMEGAGDTLVPLQGTAADGMLVNLGSNNDVTLATLPDTAAGDLAASRSSLGTLAGIVSGGKGAIRAASGDFASGAIADLAKGQAVKASSHPVTMAPDQGPLTASTATKTNVAASATSVTIFAALATRKGASVFNDSTATLYIDESGGTASATSFTVKIPTDTLWELPGPVIYTGLITGVWSSATGTARTKELS